ncbi:MAG: TolC family protein, partial [Gemmatimonadota bacterium]|nr:TolC family protein [Gemmatimonadota bacterium]
LVSLDSVAGGRPLAAWRDTELAQAVWLLSPARARAAAEVGVARAALRTAGVRRSPGAATETEYSFSGNEGSSRWGLALSGIFRLELGGKRDARRAIAEAGVLAAQAREAAEAWELAGEVRRAARVVAALRREGEALAHVIGLADTTRLLAQARYDEGTLSRTEVARIGAEASELRAEQAALRRALADAEAALAGTMGLPAAALAPLDGIRIVPLPCPVTEARAALLGQALERRWDLRAFAAEYQRAEAGLRLAVAESWPDLDLGPGIFFDHGVGKWTLGLGVPDLLLHGNRGPIGEALATRELAGARVLEAQEQALGQVEGALAACDARRLELAAVDDTAATARVTALEAAFARGEVGKLDLVLARTELARLQRRRVGLEHAMELAGSALAQAAGGLPSHGEP